MNVLFEVLALVAFWCAVSKFIFDAAVRGSAAGGMLAVVFTSETKKDRDEAATAFASLAFWMSAHLATDLTAMFLSALAVVFFLSRA